MSSYEKTAQTALKLLKKNGRSILLRRPDRTVDNVSGISTEGPATEGLLWVVILPASKGTVEAFDNRVEQSDLSSAKLRYIIAAADGAPFEPKSNDEVVFDGSVWTVLGATPLSPAGIPLLYKLGVKRS